MVRIPAVVITTPSSDRGVPLIDILRKSSLFETIELKATMGRDLDDASECDKQDEMKSYGRTLIANERACAVSHSKARSIIAQSSHGGIIFEDDARILNLTQLELITQKFLERNKNRRSVLSLLNYDSQKSRKINSTSITTIRLIPLLAEAPLAVATVQTNRAAAELATKAKSSSQVADWPKSSTRFFFLNKPLVNHGDSNTNSVIGLINERIELKREKLTNFSELQILLLKLRRKIDLLLIQIFQENWKR